MNIGNDVNRAAFLLQQGRMVAIPTETVYGLAANVFDDLAIQAVFERKGRPLDHPLIVHIGRWQDVQKVTDQMPEQLARLADWFWPGPLTLVVPTSPRFKSLCTAQQDTVALRMPNHPTTLSLLQALPFPLAAPSANPYTRVSPTQADHVSHYFPDLPYILDGGPCTHGLESTIVGLVDHRVTVLRPGALSLEEIQKIEPEAVLHEGIANRAIPGNRTLHYAPRTPTTAFDHWDELPQWAETERIGIIAASTPKTPGAFPHLWHLTPVGDLQAAGRNLYRQWIEADQLQLDHLFIQRPPRVGMGIAINDRIDKACGQRTEQGH
ncbi:MAG TPA: L-threonylcarbamoyladenylate synthase [Luteibaculaceae bacterium]|nr:L-threonylcarbamoyladenylate synthase [Luteibaculaceae bacterium]